MVTNMVFARKKKIKGREYYYVVIPTKKDGKWQKIERYIGLSPPSEKDLGKYAKEFDSSKEFINSKKAELEGIKKSYLAKLMAGKDDELANIEEEIITKFTYDTSRIEGSSLTYKDTKMLLQEGITPKEKPLRDVKETENHKKAYLYMKRNLKGDLNKRLILELHEILKKDVAEDAGKFRGGQVYVGNFIPIKASMIESEINNVISWYKKNKKLHPLELAAIFHCDFERIHPFFDGNGRVGRLLLNFILLKNNYPIAIIRSEE